MKGRQKDVPGNVAAAFHLWWGGGGGEWDGMNEISFRVCVRTMGPLSPSLSPAFPPHLGVMTVQACGSLGRTQPRRPILQMPSHRLFPHILRLLPPVSPPSSSSSSFPSFSPPS